MEVLCCHDFRGPNSNLLVVAAQRFQAAIGNMHKLW